ncbi:MAG: 16S rRNA (adenine(1518)-N(6)/adenine(1519)-N(6))-dimethyltransferase RsmA [bacterium]|nr:16S rRNA (adenine(1518)-N(6)/adenine(1519)-N(6))-dimethyltransferase RsmA [bacterium]
MPLLTPADIRSLAESLGVRPTKRLGQNFVHDSGTVRRIVRVAGVQPGDVVLEVGPGLGSLTLALLEAGATVVAVEIDPVLAAALPGTVARFLPDDAARLSVVTADALSIRSVHDLAPAAASPSSGATPPEPTKLVANLPYNVATPVILTLLATLPSLREVLVMVQAEVGERLAAGPGGKVYGSPSAKVAWYGTAAMAGMISRTVFWPVPNVDSALVRIVRHPDSPPAPEASDGASPGSAVGEGEVRADQRGVAREAVFAVVDAAFAQRRKTLRAALAEWAGGAPAAEEALRAAGIDPTRRGETLTIDDFARIAAARGG